MIKIGYNNFIMIRDIRRCSYSLLNNIFSPLSQLDDCILWIRNSEMTQQIYVSHSYEVITERKIDILFDVPLIWFDYLNPEYKIPAMQQLQARHNLGYVDPTKNIACYQFNSAAGEIKYFRCQCFKTEDFSKEQYIVGIVKSLSRNEWFNPSLQVNIDENHQSAIDVVLSTLKKHFGIKTLNLRPTLSNLLNDIKHILVNLENVIFSPREIESLYYLCQGKTAKQTAQLMSISPRTVETYLDTLRSKTGCINKLALISKFSRYFQDTPIEDNLRILTE